MSIFSHIDPAELLIFLAIIAGWIYSIGKLTQRIEDVEQRLAEHQQDAKSRDTANTKISESLIRLTALSEGMEYRLRIVEAHK